MSENKLAKAVTGTTGPLFGPPLMPVVASPGGKRNKKSLEIMFN